MTSPSELPPLKQDDELGAKAAWTREAYNQSGSALCAAMIAIHARAQDFIDTHDTDGLRDDIAFLCLEGAVQHLKTLYLNARTLGQQEEKARIQSHIAALRAFQGQLDPTD